MNKTYGGLVSQPRNSRGTTVIGTGVTHTFSGEVVETITIPEEYVVHDVIAPEGDVQVFKDQQCTEYATGAEQTVYVRLNTAVGFGEGFTVGDGSVQGDHFNVTAPSEGHDDDPYYVQVWDMWGSDDFTEAFTEGQVVKCGNGNPDFEPISNVTTVFYKPIVRQGLYVRSNAGGNYGLVVDKNGQVVYFTGGNTKYVLRFDVMNTNVLSPTDKNNVTVAELVQSYGLGTQLPEIPQTGSVYNIDGISYEVGESGITIYFTPAPSVWE